MHTGVPMGSGSPDVPLFPSFPAVCRLTACLPADRLHPGRRPPVPIAGRRLGAGGTAGMGRTAPGEVACLKFKDYVAVVTGAGQGIGRAVAQAFFREGARVVIAEVDREAGDECQAWLSSSAPDGASRVLFVPTDVADEASVARMVGQVAARFGTVDVLVNNAGISRFAPLDAENAVAAWDQVLGVNLRGAFLCARYAAAVMRQNPSRQDLEPGAPGPLGRGVIISIASTRALMSEPHGEAYGASKGGLLALTHALANSLSPHGIRVNAISPGWIDVSAWKKASMRKEPQLRPEDHSQHPAGRVGRPEDIGAACVYLASDEAGFLTGANLVVDGGMTRKMIYEEEG